MHLSISWLSGHKIFYPHFKVLCSYVFFFFISSMFPGVRLPHYLFYLCNKINWKHVQLTEELQAVVLSSDYADLEAGHAFLMGITVTIKLSLKLRCAGVQFFRNLNYYLFLPNSRNLNLINDEYTQSNIVIFPLLSVQYNVQFRVGIFSQIPSSPSPWVCLFIPRIIVS